MKNILLFLSCLFLMGSCTSSEFNDIKSNEINKFIVIMPEFQTDGIHSRSDITMGEYPNISSKWADGDSIGIFPNIGDQLSFRITASGDGKSCAFDGGGWALKPSSSYTAYSPFKRSYYYQDKDELLVSMLNQKQIGNNSTQHLGAYDIKIATGTKPADGGISFTMERKVALVRMDLIAPTAATWSSITLESDALFTTEATMDLSSSTPTLTPKSTSKTITLELSNVTTTSENKNIIAYMMLLPIDLTNKSLVIRLTDKDGYVYSSDATIVNNRTNFTANGARWIEATCGQKTVTLPEAGELASMLTDEEMLNLTSLRIEGPLNGTDIRLIREMLGCDYTGKSTDGKLSSLDLSEATIVEGGESYFEYYGSVCKTSSNKIGDSMFRECTNLQDIILPDNITSIGLAAFGDCGALTTIKIPDSVTSIGNSVFYGCDALTTIKIPDSATSIGDYAFDGCHALTTVEIGECVTSIGNSVFYGCDALTTIKIPDNVTSIGNDAFNKCTALTTVEIGDGVTSIGDYAFDGCTALTTVEIGDGVTSIGKYAFRDCGALTTIKIPDSVTSIGQAAFVSCGALTTVEIGDGVTSIGQAAFKNCGALTTIKIPDSVTSSIGFDAFYHCTSLTTVEIGDGVTSIGNNAFRDCRALTTIKIPDSVTSINDFAFSNCSALITVEIGNGVTSIDNYAFNDCSINVCYCYATNPPSINSYSFYYGVEEGATLYVPTKCVDVYKSSSWGDYFTNIEEMEE